MDAKTLYPGHNDNEVWESDYQPIIDSFGQVLVQVDEDNYQGDSYIMYKREKEYGFLIFGWGSCSGCDALQQCHTYEEIDELMSQLKNDIKWFDNLEQLKEYVQSKDHEGEYYWRYDEGKEFINKIMEYEEAQHETNQ